MIKTTNNLLVGYYAKKTLTIIYKGDIVVWESIRSCFGAGFWANMKPWLNEEGWKN